MKNFRHLAKKKADSDLIKRIERATQIEITPTQDTPFNSTLSHKRFNSGHAVKFPIRCLAIQHSSPHKNRLIRELQITIRSHSRHGLRCCRESIVMQG